MKTPATYYCGKQQMLKYILPLMPELTKVIYLKDIQSMGLLPYSSMNSIKNFLRENNIPILGKSRKHILAFQLYRAVLQIRIQELKGVYGARWTQVIQSEMNLYAQHRATLEEITSNKITVASTVSKSEYSGHAVEKKFLLDVEKITR